MPAAGIVGLDARYTWQTNGAIPGRYAVFTHRGPAATLRAFIGALWSEHLPAPGLPLAGRPDFERYPPGYDPTDPDGRVEIWVPLREAGDPS